MSVDRIHGPQHASWAITVEHASEELPTGWEWPESDRNWLGTHWAIDIGIASLSRKLATHLQAPAVLAGFSRLLIDPNRELTSETLFRTHCDGVEIGLNRGLSEAEKQARIDRCYTPFHDAVSAMLLATPRANVLSMHSFTPVYEGGAPRWMEVGVLFDRDEALAVRVAAAIEATGLRVALNEPYSGRGGLMHSATTHAATHERLAVELEVRQDLCGDEAQHQRLVAAIGEALALSED
jgi:predicted N-formylglutamate amidohydrolase